jgi:hypothetical protein
MQLDTFLDSVRDDPGFKVVISLAKEKYDTFRAKFAE